MVADYVTEQVKTLIKTMGNYTYSTSELLKLVQLTHRPTFLYNYLQPALNLELVEMTIPEKPKSSKQQYRLTKLGLQIKNKA